MRQLVPGSYRLYLILREPHIAHCAFLWRFRGFRTFFGRIGVTQTGGKDAATE